MATWNLCSQAGAEGCVSWDLSVLPCPGPQRAGGVMLPSGPCVCPQVHTAGEVLAGLWESPSTCGGLEVPGGGVSTPPPHRWDLRVFLGRLFCFPAGLAQGQGRRASQITAFLTVHDAEGEQVPRDLQADQVVAPGQPRHGGSYKLQPPDGRGEFSVAEVVKNL